MIRTVPLNQRPWRKNAAFCGTANMSAGSSANDAQWYAPAYVVVAMVRANNRTCSHTRSWNFGRGCQTTSGVGSKLSDVLQVFARLETDRPPRRDADFFSRAGVSSDAALARLHLKDAESAQLDSLATLHGGPHR